MIVTTSAIIATALERGAVMMRSGRTVTIATAKIGTVKTAMARSAMAMSVTPKIVKVTIRAMAQGLGRGPGAMMVDDRVTQGAKMTRKSASQKVIVVKPAEVEGVMIGVAVAKAVAAVAVVKVVAVIGTATVVGTTVIVAEMIEATVEMTVDGMIEAMAGATVTAAGTTEATAAGREIEAERAVTARVAEITMTGGMIEAKAVAAVTMIAAEEVATMIGAEVATMIDVEAVMMIGVEGAATTAEVGAMMIAAEVVAAAMIDAEMIVAGAVDEGSQDPGRSPGEKIQEICPRSRPRIKPSRTRATELVGLAMMP